MAQSEVLCPACNNSKATKWGSHENVSIFKCSNCETIFFPRPISNINDYTNYYPYLKYFDGARANAELHIRRKQTEAKLSKIQSILGKRPLRILDIGSGPGYFASQAKSVGHDAICGELDVEAIEFGKSNFDVEFIDVFSSEIGLFDAVCFFHVIEHLEQPDSLVARSVELLRPDGLLYAHVPLGQSSSNILETALKRLLGRDLDRRGCLYLPDHFTGFSTKGLEYFAERFQLDRIRVDTLHMYSDEYDPLFIPFRKKDIKSLVQLGLEVTRGSIDAMFGGAWLRLLARKPLTPSVPNAS